MMKTDYVISLFADIDRISEDVVGFCRIMDACPTYFEVNADISHYVYRGIKKGKALAKILARVGASQSRVDTCSPLQNRSAGSQQVVIATARESPHRHLGASRRTHSSANGTRARRFVCRR
eukprot:COSAG03_NODE_1943_length_3322_cov_2.875582_5_plen_121_part_00